MEELKKILWSNLELIMTFAMTHLKRVKIAFILALLKVLFRKNKLLSYVLRRKKNKNTRKENAILVIGVN